MKEQSRIKPDDACYNHCDDDDNDEDDDADVLRGLGYWTADAANYKIAAAADAADAAAVAVFYAAHKEMPT